MGVAGLWDVLRPAGTSRSFTAIAVDGFNDNASANNFRAFRVGIDASIWFVHSAYGKEGENPELRTIFFRLIRLLKLPILPILVFDGPMRPDIKRGKMIDKQPHWMIERMKKMVEAFGFEWRTAPGEAEAELAYLNRIGVIDAVLSDDVDTLVFGAHMVVRNPSDTLSGNRSHTQATKNHTMTFSSAVIETHPEVGLTYEDLVLVALLSGGDYHKGLDSCGVPTAVGLARAGFGRTLVEKVRSLALSVQHAEGKKTRVTLSGAERADLDAFLADWRADVANELRTNSRKFMGKRSPKAAQNLMAIGAAFPDIDVLMAYINPVTSEERAVAKAVRANPSASAAALARTVTRAKADIARKLSESIVWARDPSIGAIAKLCEDFFEWGYRDRVIKRFTNWLWEGVVCRRLRRKTILRDLGSPAGTPATAAAARLGRLGLSSSEDSSEQLETASSPLILKITSTRNHATTDHLPEYRLEIDPRALVQATEAGLEGSRSAPTTGWSDDEELQSDDEGRKGKPFDEYAPKRYWLPACMVSAGEPALASAYAEAQAAKEARKAARGRGRGRAKAGARSRARTSDVSGDEDERMVSAASTPNVTPRKSRAPATAPAIPPLAVPAAPRMNNYFKAAKSTVPAALRAEKEPAAGPSSRPEKKSAAAKGKGKTPAGSSTGRVAQLFDFGDEMRVVKDLTKPKAGATGGTQPMESTQPKTPVDEDMEYNVFRDLTMPKEHRNTTITATPTRARHRTYSRSSPEPFDDDDVLPTWSNHPSLASTAGSPMRSVTNLAATNELQPEAGPSKPSTYLTNPARVSTWKPAPFPMSDPSFGLPSDDDVPPRCVTPSPPASPPRRARRDASPRAASVDDRSDELRKSPRKSKKQGSPRATSTSPSPSRHPLPESKPKPRSRRAVMKARDVVEISSDSEDLPPPRPRPRDLRNVFKVEKPRAPAGVKGRKVTKAAHSPPRAPAEVEIIDLCSD